MVGETAKSPSNGPVRQFSVFLENKLGRLNQVIGVLAGHNVHVLALSVVDTADSATVRLVLDDPDQARDLLAEHGFFFTENEIVAVQIDSVTQLQSALAALLEAEINVHYTYAFLVRPDGKPVLAFHLEDGEMASETLRRHQFNVLRQADLSR